MKKRSLSVRLPLLFITGMLIIMLVVVLVVHSRFRSRMLREYTRMAEGVTQLMADRIDGDKVEKYIDQSLASTEYREILSYFYTLKENYPDVLYLYAYRCEEDGGHMIFDLDAEGVENGEAYEPGYVYEIEEPFASLVPNIMAGEQTEGYAVESEEDGYLFSYCRPVFRSDGSYACSVCVDFSLDQMTREDNAFTLRLMLIILAAAALILAAEIYVMHRWVTLPINKLSRCAGSFAYETEEDRQNNIALLDGVNIRSRDEIGTVYQMLRSVATDSLQSTSRLSRAKQDLRDRETRIDEISREAYRDKLTHVGNLRAFERDVEKLDGEYGLVMFDLNSLKYVNDHCGHDNGDRYLQGCCAMICAQYKRSAVYRIGGDEFVVLLRGEDFKKRDWHLSEIRLAFGRSCAAARPWERCSAAAGMAVRRRGETAKEVLKRADAEMYRDKEEYRRKTGLKREEATGDN